jgi:CubicO group peptidase (beta-lactamase class C family)
MRRFGNVYILFITVLVLLLFFQTSAAQDLTLVTPREAGLSARKLAKIDKLIQKNISQEKLKGATVLVARHGKLAYLKAFGEMVSKLWGLTQATVRN